jgi:hypothetical protein
LALTYGNALPLFTGGQVVAGSNPVSPTTERPSELAFSISLDCTYVRRHPKLSQIVNRELHAAFLVTKAFVPGMISRSYGRLSF